MPFHLVAAYGRAVSLFYKRLKSSRPTKICSVGLICDNLRNLRFQTLKRRFRRLSQSLVAALPR